MRIGYGHGPVTRPIAMAVESSGYPIGFTSPLYQVAPTAVDVRKANRAKRIERAKARLSK